MCGRKHAAYQIRKPLHESADRTSGSHIRYIRVDASDKIRIDRYIDALYVRIRRPDFPGDAIFDILRQRLVGFQHGRHISGTVGNKHIRRMDFRHLGNNFVCCRIGNIDFSGGGLIRLNPLIRSLMCVMRLGLLLGLGSLLLHTRLLPVRAASCQDGDAAKHERGSDPYFNVIHRCCNLPVNDCRL